MAEELNPEENKAVDLQPPEEGNDFYAYQKKKRQKIAALAFLAMLAILISIFSVVQMRNLLSIPLPGGITIANLKKQAEEKSKNNTEVVKDIKDEDLEVLKQRDTDADGLTDFEELYIYKTSVYLADSDSDGVNDLEEIKMQEDPNCPRGQNCFRTEELYQDEAVSPAVAVQKLNASQIRSLLLASGQLTEEQVTAVSDADLEAFYQDFLKENPEIQKQLAEESAVVDTSMQGKTPEQIMAEVDTVPVEEIKKILRQQGIDDLTLNQVDDATLRDLYKKAYEEASKNIK